jgi:nucleotide-binding universal stress UspA family protein
MRKIIAAFDGLDFSEATLEYTLFLAHYCNAHIVGVFLDDFTYHSYSVSELATHEEGITDDRLHQLNAEDRETRDKSVNRFEEACQQASVAFSIHRDRNIALQELLHESIYCDLLVIDRKENFTRFEEEVPTRFMRDLLSDVQCPVVVVPQKFKEIKKVVILYDGEPSSVYAIKTFSYLFPSLKKLPTIVLSIKSEDQTLHLPDSRLMKEFMKRHFPDAEYTIIKGAAEERILSFLHQDKEDVLVALGAYRRGRVSRWFKPSMADYLLANLKAPLFIAHN